MSDCICLPVQSTGVKPPHYTPHFQTTMKIQNLIYIRPIDINISNQYMGNRSDIKVKAVTSFVAAKKLPQFHHKYVTCFQLYRVRL